MNRLVIGTSNAGKVTEVRSALGKLNGWSLESLPPNVAEIEETGTTFLENAILKAQHYSAYTDALTLADDSGLCVAALGGRPGVRSARYGKDPEARIQRLLQEMKSAGDGERDAVFYCALALARAGQIIWTVQRDVAGMIAHSRSGAEGFGYDPVFLLSGLGRTMAELSTEEKNLLSARGKALAELKIFLMSP